MIDISQIHLSEPFTEIFPVDNKTLQSIRSNIEQNGYDEAEPLIVWKRNGKLLCVDGHTRLMAAQSLGLEEIPVIKKDFQNEDEAVSYAIHRQRDRRNLTEAELWKCIQWMDKRKERGGDHGNQHTGGKVAIPPSGGFATSAEQTAQALGISARKVERARTVMDHGDETTKQAIERWGMSINKAYEDTRAKRQKDVMEDANFEQQDKVWRAIAKKLERLEREIMDKVRFPMRATEHTKAELRFRINAINLDLKEAYQ